MKLRSLFLSDLHLGARESQAAALLGLLAQVHTENLFLVGDVIDLLSLRRRAYWPQAHSAVLAAICTLARRGTRVIYLPGNHDAGVAEVIGLWQGSVELHREYVHETLAGRRLLVAHGDGFEEQCDCPAWLSWLGSHAYDVTLAATRHVNRARALLGLPRFELVTWLKRRIPVTRAYIAGFEDAALAHARRGGYDGVVCGHIHEAQLRERDGLIYANTGDWVESCTALTEDLDGALALWRTPAPQVLGYDPGAPARALRAAERS